LRCTWTEKNNRRFKRTPWQSKGNTGCATADSEASHAIAGMLVAILKVSSAMLQPVLRYELEQVSKTDILRKLKQRFGPRPFATFVCALAEGEPAGFVRCSRGGEKVLSKF